jgi:hypothetical protein
MAFPRTGGVGVGPTVECLEGGRLADALETAAEGRGLARELAIRLLPEAPWPRLDNLRETTEARGFLLRQRLPVYAEFIFDRPGHLPAEISDRIRSAVRSDALVPTAREGARIS